MSKHGHAVCMFFIRAEFKEPFIVPILDDKIGTILGTILGANLDP